MGRNTRPTIHNAFAPPPISPSRKRSVTIWNRMKR